MGLPRYLRGLFYRGLSTQSTAWWRWQSIARRTKTQKSWSLTLWTPSNICTYTQMKDDTLQAGRGYEARMDILFIWLCCLILFPGPCSGAAWLRLSCGLWQQCLNHLRWPFNATSTIRLLQSAGTPRLDATASGWWLCSGRCLTSSSRGTRQR